MYSRKTKTTNEPTASNNKSDRPQVKIWDTWKTLKYLNINDSFHLKDLEISKYKGESKGRWPIKICRFLFVNCCLIWLSKHWKGKNICHTIYFCNNKLDTLLLKQKNFPVFSFARIRTQVTAEVRTQVTALVLRTSAITWVLMRKMKPSISNTGRFFSFNSTVSYT